MLQRLHVDNYKCLVNFDLPLRELSLLLGPNGAGKTSVLDVIHALAMLLDGKTRLTDPDHAHGRQRLAAQSIGRRSQMYFRNCRLQFQRERRLTSPNR